MATLATDDFNRANADPIGGNWVGHLFDFRIVSNRATPSDDGENSRARYTGTTPPNDQWAEAKIYGSSDLYTGCGVSIRISTSVNSGYHVVASPGEGGSGGNNIYLGKYVSDVETEIWTRDAPGGTFTTGGTVRLEAQGTTLRVFVNGVQVGTDSTDASLASGQCGLYYSSTGTVPEADDFALGDFAVATLDQEGFRWRNDDGSESSATWKAAQDTDVTLASNASARLRVLVNTTLDADAKTFELQYRKVGATGWNKVE